MSGNDTKRGFANGDNAAVFGRRGHALGETPTWSPEEARAYALVGGLTRSQVLSPEERRAQARHAARHRWAKRGRLRCSIPLAKGAIRGV